MVTWFETGACLHSRSNSRVGGPPAIADIWLATLCRENGYAATFAGERKICTSATDNIIEVSTHPSGVGFERGILAVTHSIRKCYALIPELHRILHGKLIPFCTIVQSVPKNAPKAEIADALLTADTAGSIFKNR